jgi:hypothetical protein
MWFNICELGEVLSFRRSEGYLLQEEQEYGHDVVNTSRTSGTYFLGWLHVCELNKVVLFEVKCVARRAEGSTMPL